MFQAINRNREPEVAMPKPSISRARQPSLVGTCSLPDPTKGLIGIGIGDAETVLRRPRINAFRKQASKRSIKPSAKQETQTTLSTQPKDPFQHTCMAMARGPSSATVCPLF